ncbi:hypothetical protein Gohar_001547, partial [Gossypium harknessii]|nr:hypothetical protein [Gossypium harknessii]
MKASCDGFLLVLLAGGPSRAFSRQDSQIIEDDFKALKDLFWANGDGLPADLIDKFSATVRGVLPLFRTDTESLIEQFRHVTLETYGCPLDPGSHYLQHQGSGILQSQTHSCACYVIVMTRQLQMPGWLQMPKAMARILYSIIPAAVHQGAKLGKMKEYVEAEEFSWLTYEE